MKQRNNICTSVFGDWLVWQSGSDWTGWELAGFPPWCQDLNLLALVSFCGWEFDWGFLDLWLISVRNEFQMVRPVGWTGAGHLFKTSWSLRGKSSSITWGGLRDCRQINIFFSSEVLFSGKHTKSWRRGCKCLLMEKSVQWDQDFQNFKMIHISSALQHGRKTIMLWLCIFLHLLLNTCKAELGEAKVRWGITLSCKSEKNLINQEIPLQLRCSVFLISNPNKS